jgi:hypothetical protein
MSAVETYLDELRRLLGRDPLLRRRVLAEVEDHLREAAEREGDDVAIERFGPPDLVAQAFAGERASSAVLWAAGAVLLAAGGFLVAYVVGENALPPAPWPTEEATPGYLRWKVTAVENAFAIGLVSAVGALAFAWRRVAGLALLFGATAALALGLAVGLAVVESFQRASLYEELGVPARPSLLVVSLGAVWLISLTALAGVAVAWAGRVLLTAQRASRS